MHLPGAGVGGHCIPKDPWLLVYSAAGAEIPIHLIPAARTVNDHMPMHLVDLISTALATEGRELGTSRIAVLGYAYLEDSDDIRNSPSEVLVKLLRIRGAHVTVHDPYVAEYQSSVVRAVDGTDAIVMMVGHRIYQDLNLGRLREVVRTPILVDGRHIFTRDKVEVHGFRYRCLGQGASV
jgi:UDP-N-acetyl-D-mannosaminuronic acid dehydrogenase